MTKTLGPYDSRKQAIRANGQISMSGKFCGGLLTKIDGAIYMTTDVRPRYDDELGWMAEVDVREATPDETRLYRLAVLKREKDRCYTLLSDDPSNPVSNEARKDVERLKSEIAALEAAGTPQ